MAILIDWFTVVAQVLNFLVLVWLLKRFLYRPILNAIDAREEQIATELADADAKKAEARKEQEEFNRKNEELDRQRSTLLNRAREEAKTERQHILEEARKAASDLRSKQQEALRNDKQNLNRAISRRAQQEVFAIARKALKDLAGTSLEERTVDAFAQRLLKLEGTEKEQLASALGASSSPVLVRTAFDLPQAQRDLVKKTIKETLGIEIQARFETVPDLVSGIELTANGQKVAWSIADYLSSLEKSIDELLKEQPKSEAKTEPEFKPDEPELKTEPELKPDEPELKTEPDAKARSESTDESATEQGSENKKESDREQGSETKQESYQEQESETKQEFNPELKPKK